MAMAVKPKLPKKFTPAEIRTLKSQLIKDGYRMTRDDFTKASGKLVSGMSVRKTEKLARLFHYDYIVDAANKGKAIPPSVLEDYPESKYPKLHIIIRRK